MSFKTLIPDPIRTQILAWPLSRRLLVQVLAKLAIELPGDPDRHLGDRIAPTIYREYSFTLPDESGMLHHCFFAVERKDLESVLLVVGCRHTVPPFEEN